MSAHEPRPMCGRCRRPEVVCWCPWLPSIATRTRVVLLQHPREREMAIGTARMASLCLPGSELHVGVRFDGTPALARILGDRERPPALLWPGGDAIDIAKHPPAQPITLVVVDGTWSQAKTLVRDNPELAALPRYRFVPAQPGQYRIRREPDDQSLSTIEALAHVLGVLEGDPERFAAMLRPFHAMIEMQLEQHARHRRARAKLRPRRSAQRVPPLFHTRADDLVCVAGELADGNGLGRTVVQWVAHRVATGERFEAIVAAPTVSGRIAMHSRLAADDLARGDTHDTLLQRWHDFLRPSDVVCAWGHAPSTALVVAGGVLPEHRIDLRPVARALEHGNVGALEAYHATLGVAAASLGHGRAGLRLGMLTDVVRHVVAIAEADALEQRPVAALDPAQP